MKRTPLLLHGCCAPCTSSVVERLIPDYNVTVFFDNSNISSRHEYTKRLDETSRLSKLMGFTLMEGGYDPMGWFEKVRDLRFLGEGTERCALCISLRLENTFRAAEENSFDLVATTLSVSPRKSTGMINSSGTELEAVTGISFLQEDFKKRGGSVRSIQLSKEYNLYRQNYCGCVYSKIERNREFSWEKLKSAHKK